MLLYFPIEYLERKKILSFAHTHSNKLVWPINLNVLVLNAKFAIGQKRQINWKAPNIVDESQAQWEGYRI